MSKSWLKKDLSELRKGMKGKKLSVEVKVEPPVPKAKPEPKLKPESKPTVKETFDLRVWVRGNDTPWLFTDLTKAEITKIGNDIYGCEGYIRISDRGFINLEHVLVVRVIRKLG